MRPAPGGRVVVHHPEVVPGVPATSSAMAQLVTAVAVEVPGDREPGADRAELQSTSPRSPFDPGPGRGATTGASPGRSPSPRSRSPGCRARRERRRSRRGRHRRSPPRPRTSPGASTLQSTSPLAPLLPGTGPRCGHCPVAGVVVHHPEVVAPAAGGVRRDRDLGAAVTVEVAGDRELRRDRRRGGADVGAVRQAGRRVHVGPAAGRRVVAARPSSRCPRRRSWRDRRRARPARRRRRPRPPRTGRERARCCSRRPLARRGRRAQVRGGTTPQPPGRSPSPRSRCPGCPWRRARSASSARPSPSKSPATANFAATSCSAALTSAWFSSPEPGLRCRHPPAAAPAPARGRRPRRGTAPAAGRARRYAITPASCVTRSHSAIRGRTRATPPSQSSTGKSRFRCWVRWPAELSVSTACHAWPHRLRDGELARRQRVGPERGADRRPSRPRPGPARPSPGRSPPGPGLTAASRAAHLVAQARRAGEQVGAEDHDGVAGGREVEADRVERRQRQQRGHVGEQPAQGAPGASALIAASAASRPANAVRRVATVVRSCCGVAGRGWWALSSAAVPPAGAGRTAARAARRPAARPPGRAGRRPGPARRSSAPPRRRPRRAPRRTAAAATSPARPSRCAPGRGRRR